MMVTEAPIFSGRKMMGATYTLPHLLNTSATRLGLWKSQQAPESSETRAP